MTELHEVHKLVEDMKDLRKQLSQYEKEYSLVWAYLGELSNAVVKLEKKLKSEDIVREGLRNGEERKVRMQEVTKRKS